MSEKRAWWSRRSLWIGILIVSTIISVVAAVWLFVLWGQHGEQGPGFEIKAAQAALDAATLTAAGAFVTSVGSLVAIVLSHLKNQRELELEHQMREKELELERAKLELERLKVEAQQREDEG